MKYYLLSSSQSILTKAKALEFPLLWQIWEESRDNRWIWRHQRKMIRYLCQKLNRSFNKRRNWTKCATGTAGKRRCNKNKCQSHWSWATECGWSRQRYEIQQARMQARENYNRSLLDHSQSFRLWGLQHTKSNCHQELKATTCWTYRSSKHIMKTISKEDMWRICEGAWSSWSRS